MRSRPLFHNFSKSMRNVCCLFYIITLITVENIVDEKTMHCAYLEKKQLLQGERCI